MTDVIDLTGVQPPDEFKDWPFHWISTNSYPDGEPLRWSGQYWSIHNFEDDMTPRDLAERGWRYLRPAKPYYNHRPRR